MTGPEGQIKTADLTECLGNGFLGVVAPTPGFKNQVGEKPATVACCSHGHFRNGGKRCHGNGVLEALQVGAWHVSGILPSRVILPSGDLQQCLRHC